MLKRRAAMGIAALAAAAVVLALALTGGPGYARKQKRDSVRDQDLLSLAVWADCQTDTQSKPLPSLDDTQGMRPECGSRPRRADPYDGTSYRYKVTGPRSYKLCAVFELPPEEPSGDSWSHDATGCINRVHTAAATPGAAATIPYRP